MKANLSNVWLAGSDLWAAQLDNANMQGAYLDYADLTMTGFWSTDLRGARLRYACLYRTSWRNANLTGAILRPDAKGLPPGWLIDPSSGQVSKADELNAMNV